MLTVERLRDYMRVPTGDDDVMSAAVAAVTAFVRRTPGGSVDPWAADVDHAALMLAARYVRRRATPSGIESTSDGAVYLPRRDGDVDMLLRLGHWAMPKVGGA